MTVGTRARVLAQLRLRLVGFLGLLYFAAFLDRVNVGFAASQMQRDLGFSATVYGFGAGVFFLGYCLAEVPSNLILHAVGARRWIARIMISWAVIAAAMAGIHSAGSFYLLRFLLGVAEAGFFPGVVYYLSNWVPASERARYVALFMTAVPISTAVGGPLSAAILSLDGRLGLAGWQWLFLTETIPSLILGFATLRYLADTPAQARWLTANERDWLTATLADERRAPPPGYGRTVLAALIHPRVLALSLCYFCAELGLYGVIFWVPQLLSRAGIAAAGAAVAIPYAVAACAMVWWCRRSDRAHERVRHIAAAALLGSCGLALGAFSGGSALVSVLALSLAASGTLAIFPIFWTLPAREAQGATAAGAIALINSVGNIGGFVGPFAMGWLRDATGSFTAGLLLVAGGLLLSGLIALGLGERATLKAMQA